MLSLLLLAQDAPGGSQSELDPFVANVFEHLPVVVVFGAGMIIAVVAILAGVMRSIFVSRAQERTRQEVAAYVAEGSMSAAEGESLLKAGASEHQ
ncbi:MAG: hypothetical protein P8J59_03780 [Phycisphaerales bacterium]|jgi:hypothetical protein|nr:hypothetical protein [Phycisphaerales bacterium]